jgi:single-stranded-DNA-specific exonuclease
MHYLWSHKALACENRVIDLTNELNINPILAQILLRRGVDSYQLAQRFFRPQLDHVHNPFLFREMNAAVEVPKSAAQSKFLVFI